MNFVNAHPLVATYDNTTIVVAGNAVWDTTITVPHASLGDVSAVGHSSYIDPELILYAHSGTTSEMHIHAANPTVGAVTLAKGTYKIHVWKDLPQI